MIPIDAQPSDLPVPNPELPWARFELQVNYARIAAEVTGKSLTQCLLEYTAAYKRIGIADWGFNPAVPQWQAFCQEVEAGADIGQLIYRLNKQQPEATSLREQFGCFSYEQYPDETDKIHLHFNNRDQTGLGPLASVNLATRVGELKSMVTRVREQLPGVRTVKGASWVYNYRVYRSLFPASYTANLVQEEPPFPRSTGLWGQFITSEGKLNQQRAQAFLAKAAAARDEFELLHAFPFQLFYAKGPIADFYDFYGL